MPERVFATGVAETAREWRVQGLPGFGELEERFLDFTCSPRRDARGVIVGTNSTCIDVTDRVRERQAAQARAGEAQRRFEAVRDVVAELQHALLPGQLPVLPQVRLAARYLVAAQDQTAGGDWFDAVPLPDGRVALIVGDVVGHGVAASAAMGQLRTLLTEVLLQTGDVDQALAWADRMAARSLATRAATVCVAALDAGSGELRYSTCGHPPPLLVAADGATRYLPTSGGGPLGTGSPLSVRSDTVAVGEELMLYSDGLIERPGQPQAQGMATLAEAAGAAVANRALPVGAPTSAAERACLQSVELITRRGYDDDVTVLAAQRASTVAPVRCQFPAAAAALTEARTVVGAWLDRLDVTRRDRSRLDLAISELIANAVEHAYPPSEPGLVRLDATLGADGVVQIVVSDDGIWNEPRPAPAATSGRGLWMIGSILDDLQLAHEPPAGTVVTARYRLCHPAVLSADPGQPTPGRDHMPYAADLDEGSPRLLRVSGAIDMTTAGQFEDRLNLASRGGVHPLTVDLTKVDVLASAGVSVLFRARDHHTAHATQFTLIAAPGSVPAQVLDLVGLEHTHASRDCPQSG